MIENKKCPVFEYMPVQKCSGCEACVNVCPVSALSLKDDSIGFLYPIIQADKCIGCNKCLKICPMLNIVPSINSEETYYGVSHVNNDILLQSASGGVFSFLVDCFKKMYPDGNIVGAVYTDDFKKIEHCLSKDYKDIYKMNCSKYFQSNKKRIYIQVKERLQNDEAVLFTGAPCEVAALYYYLDRKDYEKLWTMDFICKGSSSPRILQEYVEYLEKKFKSKTVYLNMRYKWRELDNWIPQFLMVRFESGKKLFKEFYNTELGIGFQILQRDSCHSCPFREWRHYSDFTVGDLHGADKNSTIYNHLGISTLIINNEKGRILWNGFDKRNLKIEELDKKLIYSKNRSSIDARYEKLKKRIELLNSIKAIRRSVGIKTKIKMIMPVMLLRKITTWRREHSR